MATSCAKLTIGLDVMKTMCKGKTDKRASSRVTEGLGVPTARVANFDFLGTDTRSRIQDTETTRARATPL